MNPMTAKAPSDKLRARKPARLTDLEYSRLDPERMGFLTFGTLAPAEQKLLTHAFHVLKAKMGMRYDAHVAAREIFWLNIWQDEDEGETMSLNDEALETDLDRFCRDAIARYGEPHAVMDGYGFVVNPIGSKTQVWHVDYSTDASAVWIPITRFTEKNAMQFVTLPEGAPDEALERIARHVDEVDLDALAADVPSFRVQQVVAQPFQVMTMGRGTIHRGITNTGDFERVAFYVSMHFIRDWSTYPYAYDERAEPGVVDFNT